MNDPLPVKVVRGGSWSITQARARLGFRVGVVPGFRRGVLGFRVMRTPRAPATLLVVRGGSWGGSQIGARSANRVRFITSFRNGYVGFRVMKTGGKV